MPNIEMLSQKIDESGMTMTSLSLKAGIKRETLYNRLNLVGEFTATEIVGLTKALHLTKTERDTIFLS